MAIVDFSIGLVIHVEWDGGQALVDVVSDELERPMVQHWPPGRWRLGPGSDLRRVLRGVGRMLGRAKGFAWRAIRQLDPGQAEAELGRWEGLLRIEGAQGVPLAVRRANASARLRARGGQSAAYFRRLLDGMGYQDIEVVKAEDSMRIDDRVDDRLDGEGWAFVLIVRATSIPELDPLAERIVREGVRASVVVLFEWV